MWIVLLGKLDVYQLTGKIYKKQAPTQKILVPPLVSGVVLIGSRGTDGGGRKCIRRHGSINSLGTLLK
jgi:hypothetical protein